MTKTLSQNKGYYLQLGAMVGGPVLLYFSTSLLYRFIAPHVLIDEFQLTRMLWATFCGGWLGALTLDLCYGSDDLSKRIEQVKGNAVLLVFFTCCYLWGRRDEFVETLPGPISIFVWCLILVGLCYTMQRETSANRLLRWQEPVPILRSRSIDFSDLFRTLQRGIVLLCVAVVLISSYFIFAPQELQSKELQSKELQSKELQSKWSALTYPVLTIFLYLYILRLLSRTKLRQTYEINSEGLVFQDGLSRQRYRWSDIEWYSFGDSMSVPGMRWLHFQATTREKTEDGLFSFDPQEVEESKVKQILVEHLGPGREVANA